MDRLFTLTSYKSELSQEYFPPIELDKDGVYALGLYSLNTYNSIPNIVKYKNDLFYYSIVIGSSEEGKKYIRRIVRIPEGIYEIEEFEKVILDTVILDHQTYLPGGHFSRENLKLSIKANINTQKVEILASFPIQFETSDSIGSVLGFQDIIIPEDQLAASNSLVKITTVDIINVECNIVNGSYLNGQPSHTLFSFCPNDVPPGYKISLQPTNMLFLPVNTKQISNITLRLVDQGGKLVNFRGEQIVIQLNLRKLR